MDQPSFWHQPFLRAAKEIREQIARILIQIYEIVAKIGFVFPGIDANLIRGVVLFELFRHWRLLLRMVERDLRSKYVGSLIGIFWTIINPLLLLLVFTFIFSIIFRARFGNEASVGISALYILCGLIPWLGFQEGVARSANYLVENRNLISRVKFPAAVLPCSAGAKRILRPGHWLFSAPGLGRHQRQVTSACGVFPAGLDDSPNLLRTGPGILFFCSGSMGEGFDPIGPGTAAGMDVCHSHFLSGQSRA